MTTAKPAAPATPISPAEQQRQLLRRLLDAYGVKTVAELRGTDAFKKALVAAKNNEKAAFDSLFRKRERVDLQGWFLDNTVYIDYNKKTQERKVKDRGAVVILADGRVVTFWLGVETRLQPLTPIKVTGLVQSHDLETGKLGEPRKGDDTKIVHDPSFTAALPTLSLAHAVKDATTRNKRGVWEGETPAKKRPVATLKVGDPKEVSFFEARDENKGNTLKVVLVDPSAPVKVGEHTVPFEVQAKLDVDYINDSLSLHGASESAEYRDALADKTFIARGILKMMRWTNMDMMKREGIDDDAEANIQVLTPFLKPYKKSDSGVQLRALDLNDAQEKLGRDMSEGIDVGPYKFMDLREEDDPGNFIFYLRCRTPADLLKADGTPVDEKTRQEVMRWPLPTIDCLEKPFTYRNGPQKGEDGVMNQGAFLRLIDRVNTGKGPTLRDQLLEGLLSGEVSP